MVKNLLAMQEMWVQTLGWEDLPEKRMATHCSILAWEIPGTRGAWRATVTWSKKRWTQLSDWATLIKKLNVKMKMLVRNCIYFLWSKTVPTKK